ncbi:hypothetical protein BDN71DRAFT_1502404 [Pleurotus eryngii]|uniref:Uncharacterized protein n=1 Tax=Pleurotus eryngii TaxID=5323 RepID=A0A9P6A9Q4_PLEER|nr:hypothetical protein BDN71DRAFT_1502404 [Pleurotus eryngii]
MPAGLEAALLRTTICAVASAPAFLTDAAAVDPTTTEPEETTTPIVPATVVLPAPVAAPAAIAVPLIPVNAVPPAPVAAPDPVVSVVLSTGCSAC